MKKKLQEANKLKEKIESLDELEMYSIYQILEKNQANFTNNRNGIYFDLYTLNPDIYKTLELFVNQSIERKKMLNQDKNN